MHLRQQSQVRKLGLSNDRLIEIYQALYYSSAKKDDLRFKKIDEILEIREEIKIHLRSYLFDLKNDISGPATENQLIRLFPLFQKVEKLTRSVLEGCTSTKISEKEKENQRLFFELIYNQDISPAIIQRIKQKRNFERFGNR